MAGHVASRNRALLWSRPVIATALCAVLALAPPPGKVVRDNDAYARRKGAVYTVVGAARLGVLLYGGAQVIQPVGFGAGLSFRIHGLHLGPLIFGGEVHFGHTRFLERRNVATMDGGNARRYAALGHSDFALGPSFRLRMGPVYADLGFAAGLGVSTLVRPRTTEREDDFTDATAMIRGGGHLGIPIRNDSGIVIGVAVHKYFSKLQVAANPDPLTDDVPPDTNPFDLMIETYVGYAFMF
jgi:hypothetical protein